MGEVYDMGDSFYDLGAALRDDIHAAAVTNLALELAIPGIHGDVSTQVQATLLSGNRDVIEEAVARADEYIAGMEILRTSGIDLTEAADEE